MVRDPGETLAPRAAEAGAGVVDPRPAAPRRVLASLAPLPAPAAPGVAHPLRAHLIEMERRAGALAARQAAPRHWMLLLAEFSAEAAVHFRLAEEPETEAGYAQLAQWLNAAAAAQPAERQVGAP